MGDFAPTYLHEMTLSTFISCLDSLVACQGIKSDSSSRETISGRKGPGKIDEAGRWYSPILGLGPVPGLGTLHVDTSARDSLACDLMEPCASSSGRLLA